MKFRSPYSLYSILFIIFSTVAICYSPFRNPENLVAPEKIGGDGKDYYSYLVSFFIDESLVKAEDPGYIIAAPAGTINMHTVGTAIMQSPFFMAGYVWAKVANYDLNGYSEPFQKMVGFAAFFYVLTGFIFLRKLLLNIGFHDFVIAVILLLLYFGTNLINFTINEPSMSHIYSFSLISSFLYYVHRLFSGYTGKSIYASAFLLGLVIITRPINGLIIFVVPFFLESMNDFKQKITDIIKDKKRVFVSLIILIGVLSIQSTYWYIHNRTFIQWTYKDYGFYFSKPHLFSMLLSFRCGLFIYTPLYFISLFGLIFLFKENKFKSWSIILFMFLCAYIFSCWCSWPYYDGIGVRVFADFSAITGILIAKLISSVSNRLLNCILFLTLAAGLFIYQIFYYQYQTGILPGAAMNYEKFKYIFLKTSAKYKFAVGGYGDLPPYSKHPLKVTDSYENDFKKSKENVEKIDNHLCLPFHGQEYGGDYKYINTADPCKLYVEISLKRMEPFVNSSSEAIVVYSIESPDNSKKYYMNFKMNETPSAACHEWKQYYYTINSTYKIEGGDRLKIYIWNKDKQYFYVDDYKIKVYRY